MEYLIEMKRPFPSLSQLHSPITEVLQSGMMTMKKPILLKGAVGASPVSGHLNLVFREILFMPRSSVFSATRYCLL
jgi:hypothetical protein